MNSLYYITIGLFIFNGLLLLLNILCALHIRFISMKIKQIVGLNISTTHIRTVTEGVFAIELLYLMAFLIWAPRNIDILQNGFLSRSEFLYIFTEYIKNIYLLILMIPIALKNFREFKQLKKLKDIKNEC